MRPIVASNNGGPSRKRSSSGDVPSPQTKKSRILQPAQANSVAETTPINTGSQPTHGAVEPLATKIEALETHQAQRQLDPLKQGIEETVVQFGNQLIVEHADTPALLERFIKITTEYAIRLRQPLSPAILKQIAEMMVALERHELAFRYFSKLLGQLADTEVTTPEAQTTQGQQIYENYRLALTVSQQHLNEQFIACLNNQVQSIIVRCPAAAPYSRAIHLLVHRSNMDVYIQHPGFPGLRIACQSYMALLQEQPHTEARAERTVACQYAAEYYLRKNDWVEALTMLESQQPKDERALDYVRRRIATNVTQFLKIAAVQHPAGFIENMECEVCFIDYDKILDGRQVQVEHNLRLLNHIIRALNAIPIDERIVEDWRDLLRAHFCRFTLSTRGSDIPAQVAALQNWLVCTHDYEAQDDLPHDQFVNLYTVSKCMAQTRVHDIAQLLKENMPPTHPHPTIQTPQRKACQQYAQRITALLNFCENHAGLLSPSSKNTLTAWQRQHAHPATPQHTPVHHGTIVSPVVRSPLTPRRVQLQSPGGAGVRHDGPSSSARSLSPEF